MKRMFVAPDLRGRGLGRLLATAIMDRGRELGYRRMVLDTLEHMLAPIHLYESLGFKRCPAYYDNPLPGVVYFGFDYPKSLG